MMHAVGWVASLVAVRAREQEAAHRALAVAGCLTEAGLGRVHVAAD